MSNTYLIYNIESNYAQKLIDGLNDEFVAWSFFPMASTGNNKKIKICFSSTEKPHDNIVEQMTSYCNGFKKAIEQPALEDDFPDYPKMYQPKDTPIKKHYVYPQEYYH